MSMVTLNQAGQVVNFTYPAGVAAKYFVFKNGAAIGFGTGAIFQSGSPGVAFVNVTLTANDVNTLGTLQIALLDAANNLLAGNQYNVVVYPVGVAVQSVQGDVTGNLLGNVFNTLNIGAATRVLIAQNVWNVPDTIESGLTAQNAMRCMFAVLAGKDIVGPLAARFRNFGDTKDRVSMTFDNASQRLTVVYDFS